MLLKINFKNLCFTLNHQYKLPFQNFFNEKKVITYNTLALLEQKISIITTDSWTSINSRRWMKQNKKNIHPISNEENFEIAIDSSV
jgi:hypothetical protein